MNNTNSSSVESFRESSFPTLTAAFGKHHLPDSTGKQQLIQESIIASISPPPPSSSAAKSKGKKKVTNLTQTVQAFEKKTPLASPPPTSSPIPSQTTSVSATIQEALNKEIELTSETAPSTNTPLPFESSPPLLSEIPEFTVTQLENEDDQNQSFHQEETSEKPYLPVQFTAEFKQNASEEHPLDQPFEFEREEEKEHLSPDLGQAVVNQKDSFFFSPSTEDTVNESHPSSTEVGSVSIKPHPVELTQEEISTFITSLKDHLSEIAGFRATVSQENPLYETIIQQFSTAHELQDQLRKDCEITQKKYRQIVEQDKRVSDLFTTNNTALQERLILRSTEEAVLKAMIIGVNNLKDSGVGLYERYGAEWRLWELTATPGWLSSGGFLNIRKKTLGITDEIKSNPTPIHDEEIKPTHPDDAYLQQIEKLLVDMAILKEEILIWNQAFYAVQNLLRDHDLLKKITEYHSQQLKTHEERLGKLKLLKGPLQERLTEDLKLETLPGSPSHQNASRRLVQLEECWKMIDNRQERGGKFLNERINHFKLVDKNPSDKKLEKIELDKEPVDNKLDKNKLKDDPGKVFADFSTKFTTAFSLIREIVALKEQVTLENQWENYFDPEKRKTLYFNSLNSCKELQKKHEVCKTEVLPEVETALKIEKHLVVEKMRGLKSAIEENMKKLEQDMTKRSGWNWHLSSKV